MAIDMSTGSLRMAWEEAGRPEDHPYVYARALAAQETAEANRVRVVVGVGGAGHGQAAGLAEAAGDLAHKLNGHDGSHPSCRACFYVRSLGSERAIERVPEAFRVAA